MERLTEFEIVILAHYLIDMGCTVVTYEEIQEYIKAKHNA